MLYHSYYFLRLSLLSLLLLITLNAIIVIINYVTFFYLNNVPFESDLMNFLPPPNLSFFEKMTKKIANKTRVFQVEKTWKPPFPRRLNVEYTWCAWREELLLVLCYPCHMQSLILGLLVSMSNNFFLKNVITMFDIMMYNHNLGLSICRLFYFLAQFLFTTSESELDYYHRKANVRVAERLKT